MGTFLCSGGERVYQYFGEKCRGKDNCNSIPGEILTHIIIILPAPYNSKKNMLYRNIFSMFLFLNYNVFSFLLC